MLPCTTKSPPTITSPVVVTLAKVTLFPCPTPCIVPVPSNVVNLLAAFDAEEINEPLIVANDVNLPSTEPV